MKKYYLNFYDRTNDYLLTVKFTDENIESSKNSSFWGKPKQDLINYVVSHFVKTNSVINVLDALLAVILNKSTLGFGKISTKRYNSFLVYFKDDYFILLDPYNSNDKDHSIDYVCQYLFGNSVK